MEKLKAYIKARLAEVSTYRGVCLVSGAVATLLLGVDARLALGVAIGAAGVIAIVFPDSFGRTPKQ